MSDKPNESVQSAEAFARTYQIPEAVVRIRDAQWHDRCVTMASGHLADIKTLTSIHDSRDPRRLALVEAARKLDAAPDPVGFDDRGEGFCVYCHGDFLYELPRAIKHEADCPIESLRKALKDLEEAGDINPSP